MNTKDTSTTDATLNKDSQETLLSFRHQLFRFARSKLPEWDAEDAVQETLIKGFYGLKSLRKPERLQSWLYAICRNEISNILQADSTPTFIQHDKNSAMTRDQTLYSVFL